MVTWLDDILKKYGGDKRITRLKLKPARDQVAAEGVKLNEWKTKSEDWNDDTTWSDERQILQTRVAGFQNALRTLNRHKESMEGAIKDIEKERAALKIDWRKGRDKYRGWVEQKKVPAHFAKCAGDACREQAVTALSVGIKLDYFHVNSHRRCGDRCVRGATRGPPPRPSTRGES